MENKRVYTLDNRLFSVKQGGRKSKISWAQDMVVWIGKCFALDEVEKAVAA